MGVSVKRIWARLAALVLAFVCAASPALAAVRFSVEAQVNADLYPADVRDWMAALAELAQAAAVEGVFQQEGERFSLDMAVEIPHRADVNRTEVRVAGVPSHWQITSPMLGDTALMLNNLALLEFGVKAYNHLGLPVQNAALLVPYTHTSAWEALAAELAPLLPEEDGVTVLSAAEVGSLFSRISETVQIDRTLRCWVEAIGLQTGGDQLIYAELDKLAATLPTCGALTVTRENGQLTWRCGDVDLLTHTLDGEGTQTLLMWPGLGAIWVDWQHSGGMLRCEVNVAFQPLSGHVKLHWPTRLDVDESVSVAVDLKGTLAGDAPLRLFVEGELAGGMLTLRHLAADKATVLSTVTVATSPVEAPPLPEWTGEDITGVNVLSLTGPTLGELMAQVRIPLVKGLMQLVAALPAKVCQTGMDWLEGSGILPLLTDAMQGGLDAY